jgi:cell division protein FtsZ
MKLLEVDEAANHSRELVDSDANIIWGSAFNPDLQGKIRVSVVATGIEQSAEQAEIASRPMNFSNSRGPVRPNAAPAAPVQAERAPSPYSAPKAPVAQAPQPAPSAPEPFDLGAEAELDGDDAALELGGSEEIGETQAPVGGSSANPAGRPMRQPLDLSTPDAQAARSTKQDELDLKANAAEAAMTPPRRRPIVPEPAPTAPAAPASRPATTGSTLFERMSNLSRGVKPTPTDDGDDDEGGSISIPRFLGRQNNQ